MVYHRRTITSHTITAVQRLPFSLDLTNDKTITFGLSFLFFDPGDHTSFIHNLHNIRSNLATL